MIDGVVASSYTNMLGSKANMHAVTAAGRALYRLAPSLFRYVHAKRVAEPMSLAIGKAASKVYCEPLLWYVRHPADLYAAASSSIACKKENWNKKKLNLMTG